MPRHSPIATTRRVSLLRKRRRLQSKDGKTYTPTRNHIMRKNINLPTEYSNSDPSTLLLIAIEERSTIIKTAKRSSTMSTARTREANLRCLKPMSLKALIIMVVEDIDSIPPKNRLLMLLKSRRCPTAKPAHIIPLTIIRAVTIAEPPEFTSFLKLNSNPRENRRTTMPICAQKSMFSSVVTDGRYSKCGLARKPATM